MGQGMPRLDAIRQIGVTIRCSPTVAILIWASVPKPSIAARVHFVGFDDDGTLVLRKKIKRLALVATFEKFPRCIIGMEACMSAHFVSWTLRKLGFQPRIIPAKFVKPFNKGQKNDYNDAEAIAEAALRPNLNFVSEKTQDQLDLQALHRVRSRLVTTDVVSLEIDVSL